jgi:hypothetical protein
MGKTFGELTIGDSIYCINISEVSTGIKKGNCEKAYKILGQSFSLGNYPSLYISSYEISNIREEDCGTITLILREGRLSRFVGPLGKNHNITVYKKSKGNYVCWSPNKKDVIETAKEILSALITVEKNNAQIRCKIFHDMILKINEHE